MKCMEIKSIFVMWSVVKIFCYIKDTVVLSVSSRNIFSDYVNIFRWNHQPFYSPGDMPLGLDEIHVWFVDDTLQLQCSSNFNLCLLCQKWRRNNLVQRLWPNGLHVPYLCWLHSSGCHIAQTLQVAGSYNKLFSVMLFAYTLKSSMHWHCICIYLCVFYIQSQWN